MSVFEQIRIIDKRIDGIRLELHRRGPAFSTFDSHGWQCAWDRNPDLYARHNDLFRQRGDLQVIRDAEIEKRWRAQERAERRSRLAAWKRVAA
jgi:hypothetical protein